MNEVAKKAGGEALEKALQLNQFFIFVVLPKDAAGPKATVKYWGDMLHGKCFMKFTYNLFCYTYPGLNRNRHPGGSGEQSERFEAWQIFSVLEQCSFEVSSLSLHHSHS